MTNIIEKNLFTYSQIDSNRFGMDVFFVNGSIEDYNNNFEKEFTGINKNKILVISKIRGSDKDYLEKMHFLQKNQFLLMTTKMFMSLNMNNFELLSSLENLPKGDLKRIYFSNDTDKCKFEKIEKEDTDSILKIAFDNFKGYVGHYHANPLLDKNKCDEIYVDWTKNIISRDDVFKFKFLNKRNEIIGFTLSHHIDETTIIGDLLAINEKYRPYVYWLYANILHFVKKEYNVKKVITDTQVANENAFNLSLYLGFKYFDYEYVLHYTKI